MRVQNLHIVYAVFSFFLCCFSVFPSEPEPSQNVFVTPQTLTVGFEEGLLSDTLVSASLDEPTAKAILYIFPNTVFTLAPEITVQATIVYIKNDNLAKSDKKSFPKTINNLVSTKSVFFEQEAPKPFKSLPYPNKHFIISAGVGSAVVFDSQILYKASAVSTIAFDFLQYATQKNTVSFGYINTHYLSASQKADAARPPPFQA